MVNLQKRYIYRGVLGYDFPMTVYQDIAIYDTSGRNDINRRFGIQIPMMMTHNSISFVVTHE